MEIKGFTAGPASVLCNTTLVLETTSAMAITAIDTAGNPGAGTVRHHLSPETVITTPVEKGADGTRGRADLWKGDAAAAKAWLEQCFETHNQERTPPHLTNATRQHETITNHEEEGVDLTGVQAALWKGDPAAVNTWLENHSQVHHTEGREESGHSSLDLTSATQQHEIIAELESEGVDDNVAMGDIRVGDTTAVQTWLETYLYSHEGELALHYPRQDT